MDLYFRIKLLKLIVAISENKDLNEIHGEKFYIGAGELCADVAIHYIGHLSGDPTFNGDNSERVYVCIAYMKNTFGEYKEGLFLHSKIWKEAPNLFLDDIKGIISDYESNNLDETSMRLAFGNLLCLKDPQPTGYKYPLMESLTDAIDTYELKFGKL